MGLEFEELSSKVIKAAIEVHKKLGPGFLESIYRQALLIELGKNGLHVITQKEIKLYYDGIEIGTHRLDLLVEDEIIVELKVVKEIADIHIAQLVSYLRATGLKIGLLLNFAKPTLEIKRVVN